MWTAQAGKASSEGVSSPPFVFAPLHVAHPRFDFLCIGGQEALLSALLVRTMLPDAFVAVIFAPSPADVILPMRLHPLQPDFAAPAFQGLDPTVVTTIWEQLARNAAHATEVILPLCDLSQAFEARASAQKARGPDYLDVFETRHALPHLRQDDEDFTLEGAYHLADARLFRLDMLTRSLFALLAACGCVLFRPSGLVMDDIEVKFAEGGSLGYLRLLAPDMPERAGRAHERPAISLRTDILSRNALASETFHAFAAGRGETVFIGQAGADIAHLADEIGRWLPGLAGASLMRSFYLPCSNTLFPAQTLGHDGVRPFLATRLAALGLCSFGANGAHVAARALSGFSDPGEAATAGRIDRWFAAQP